ncbi:nuclear transport factor 2 family protein [Flavobacterium sp. MK4S-17]|uniref:nuclear transport factor 2 family protein n=1 Tax=Flavobacterium sp. MK4S-17 TaxID=2543737 RepID=UPI00135B3F7E|nr:nuclear transport factor 2 family protein [Flavobacterium sp. MK4S-17]
MDTLQQIETLESRLIEAMKENDIKELDALLDDGLIFTAYNGQVFNKEADIESHRSGNIKIFSIDVTDRIIKLLGDVAIVSVKKEISGSFFGKTEAGIFRYTRVWALKNDSWKIVAGHATRIIH